MNYQSVRDQKSPLMLGLLAFQFSLTICGCQSVEPYVSPGVLPYVELSSLYFQTELRQNSSLDVLQRMKAMQGSVDPKHVEKELVTQSDTVIALSGHGKKGHKSWFTLFAFDQHINTSVRKYFFFVEEDAVFSPMPPQKLLIPTRSTLVFDGATLIGDVLTLSHGSEEQRRLAIVHYVAKHLRQDIERLSQPTGPRKSGDVVSIHGMFMNQVFRDALVELETYPVLTRELNVDPGVKFHQTSFGAGTLKITLVGDVAHTHIEVGLPQHDGPKIFDAK